MADITPTEANVILVSGRTRTRNAASTVTVGDWVYEASTSTVDVAANNAAATDEVVGCALNAGTAGQPIVYALNDSVVGWGAVLTLTETYVLSVTGLMSPIADIATSDWVTRVGYAITTSNLKLDIKTFGLEAP